MRERSKKNKSTQDFNNISTNLSRQTKKRAEGLQELRASVEPFLEEHLPDGLKQPPKKMPNYCSCSYEVSPENLAPKENRKEEFYNIIFVPKPHEIHHFLNKTVESFCSYAEAMLVPNIGYRMVGFVSVCHKILQELSTQNTDVGGLFLLLENIILMAVDSCFLCCGRPRHPRLTKLSKLQKQSLRKNASFPRKVLFQLMREAKSIKNACKVHKKCFSIYVKSIIKQHGKAKRSETSNQRSVRFVRSNTWSKQIHISDTFSKASALIAKEKKIKKIVENERSSREKIQALCQKLQTRIKRIIMERIAYGLGCLTDIVLEFVSHEREAAYIKFINDILDNMGDIAECIITAFSNKYYCVKIEDFPNLDTTELMRKIPYLQTVTFSLPHCSSELPFIIPAKSPKVKDKSRVAESLVYDNQKVINQLKGQVTHHINSMVVTLPMEKDDGADENNVSYFYNSIPVGIFSRGPRNELAVLHVRRGPRFRQCPGFMNPRQGSKVSLLFRAASTNVAFGWCKSSLISCKKWGFFKRDDIIFRPWTIETNGRLSRMLGRREWVHEGTWAWARLRRTEMSQDTEDKGQEIPTMSAASKSVQFRQTRMTYQNWDNSQPTVLFSIKSFRKNREKDLDFAKRGVKCIGDVNPLNIL